MAFLTGAGSCSPALLQRRVQGLLELVRGSCRGCVGPAQRRPRGSRSWSSLPSSISCCAAVPFFFERREVLEGRLLLQPLDPLGRGLEVQPQRPLDDDAAVAEVVVVEDLRLLVRP